MIRSTRRGGYTGSARLDDAHGVIGAQNYAQWSSEAQRMVSQGGRIVKRGDQSTFHVVSPAGLDWGTFDRMSGKEIKGTLRPIQEDSDYQDITDQFRND